MTLAPPLPSGGVSDLRWAATVFARSTQVIGHNPGVYGVVVLLFGILPWLAVPALSATAPQEMSSALIGWRLVAMGLFIVGDACLCGMLSGLVLARAMGQPVRLGSLAGQVRQRFAPLLVVSMVLVTPVLGLSLLSGWVRGSASSDAALYLLRFCVGVGLQTCLGCASALVMADGSGGIRALGRAWVLTRGRRIAILLFVVGFFVVKVLAPYVVLALGLQSLVDRAPAAWAFSAQTLSAVVSGTVWSLLGSMLAVAMAVIHGQLRGDRLYESLESDPNSPRSATRAASAPAT